MIKGNPSIPQRVPIQEFPTPRGLEDVILRERRDSRKPSNSQFEYGEAHPDTVKYPGHKLARVIPDSELGWTQWIYVKGRDQQNLYNWETSTEPEWPILKQTFVVLREDFNPVPDNLDTEYPPPQDLFESEVLSEYSITGVVQSRSGDPELDSLFVIVVVTREKLVLLSGEEFDPETGNLYSFSREKVPAGTPGSGINNYGSYSEVRPLNSLWSIRTIKQAAGLAGAAAPVNPELPELGGVTNRLPYPKIVNYSWPGVLSATEPFSVFRPPLRNGGYGRAIVTPNYLRNPYDGPCVALVIEQWTSEVPAVTALGNALFPVPINWDGALLQVSIPPTLHQGFEISETSGTDHPDYKYYFYKQYMPPTVPADWPTYIDTSLDIRPFFGGYLSRRIRVYNPHYYDFSTIISLVIFNVTDTTVRIGWATGATGSAYIYIKPAAGAWPVTPTATVSSGNEYLFTMLTALTSYQIKVVIGSVTSNIAPVTTTFGVPAFTNGPFTLTLLEDAAMTSIDYNATGGSIVFSAIGLLTGLSINASTGIVSGTPTPDLSSNTSATVSASNDIGSVSQALTLNYTAKPTVSPGQSFSFLEGDTSVLEQIVATNSPTSWSPAWAPTSPVFNTATGLTLNTTTGQITGDATGILSQAWTLNITASNAAGDRGAVAVAINYTAKPTITAGQSFSRPHNASPITDIQIVASNSPTYWTYDGTVSHPASPIDNDFFFAETNLSFDTATGKITGSTNNHSQNIGTWVLQFTAYNDAGNRGSVNVTIILT